METKEELRDVLNRHFGEASVRALEDGGRLVLADSLEAAADYLQDADFFSKINNRTHTIVPDALAHDGNPDGILARVDFKGKNGFPSGNVIVEPGRHRANKHRGKGAIHLTGSALEFPHRDLYPEESNKTESGVRAVVDVLLSTDEVIRTNSNRKEEEFVFYSKKMRQILITTYDFEKEQFKVITNYAVKPYKVDEMGNDRVRASGAIHLPEIGDSVSPHPFNQNDTDTTTNTESLPGEAQRASYSDVDYTGFVRHLINNADESTIGQEQARVQGFYSRKNRQAFLIADTLNEVSAPAVLLHEIGVHMAYDVGCRDDMQKLADQAPQILAEAAIRQDPVALRVEERLTESEIFDGDPNYALETCAYLVEESFKAAQPSNLTEYWLSRVRYGINTWLYDIGFRDVARLTHQELSLIAQGNVETLSHDAVLQRKVFHPTEEDSLDRLQWFLEKRLGQASGRAVTQIVRDLSKKQEVPEESEEVKTSRRMF